MPSDQLSGPSPLAAFPSAAPAADRNLAQGIVDSRGIISLTHNADVAGAFVLLEWNEAAGWWVQNDPQLCAPFARVAWKVDPGTKFYIYATAALLTGAAQSKVFVGGVTLSKTPYSVGA